MLSTDPFAKVKLPRGNLSSGLPGLDLFLGGGYPMGRFVEIYGPNSVGKSTLVAHGMAATQHEGGRVAYFDLEGTYDPTYGSSIGVRHGEDVTDFKNPENPFYYRYALGGEDALEEMIECVNSGMFKQVVVDSIHAMVPRARLDSDVGKALPAIRARLISEMCDRLRIPLLTTGTSLLCVNREAGTMKADSYGNPINTSSGGISLKFEASIRLKLKAENRPANTKGEPDGKNVTIKQEKNKAGGVQFAEHELYLEFGKGFDVLNDLLGVAVSSGAVKRSGAWIVVGEQKFNGVDAFQTAVEGDPKLYAQIKALVKAA